MKTYLFTLLSAAFLLPSAASAALLSQEGFSGYSLGQLPATTSPTVAGYTGNWTGVDFGNLKPAVAAGSLSYAGANYATGLGNKVTVANNVTGGEITANNSGRTYRLLDSNLAVTNATAGTMYLSFLFQSGQETGATTYQMLELKDSTDGENSRNFDIGLSNNGGMTGSNYDFSIDGVYTSTGVAANTNVHLMVVKFVLSATAASDSVTVWVDPVLGAGEPAGGTTVTGKDLTWDRLAFSDYDGNSCAWDEIRWGTDFNSVTVQPVVPAVPTFTLQPSAYSGNVGSTVNLTSLAESNPAPTYQWEKSADGSTGWAAINGATQATLVMSPAAFTNNGYYRVTATNGNPPAATSDVVLVYLAFPPPAIGTQPVSTVAQVGSNVTLSVAATGLGSLSYQWYRGVDPVGGATTNTFTLNNVQLSDSGDYNVEVTDHAAEGESPPESATTIFSNTATVSVFTAWSGLVSHDPFDTTASYTAGGLATQNPTIAGYTGAWAITNGFGPISPVVSSGSLVYPNPLYLGSSGDSVSTPADATAISATNSGRVGRLLDPKLVVNDSTTGTRYVSWLFRSGFENAAPNPQVYQTLAFFNGALGTDANRHFEAGIAVGAADFNTTNFAFRLNNNTGMVGNLGVPSDANVHLFVAKIELSATAGSDSVTVWIDPALGSADPAGGVTVTGTDLQWDRIALSDYASDSSHWDEIRWGSTFNSVTLNTTPTNNYAAWIAGYPAVGGNTGFTQDADGDGIKNGLENFFGTNPGVSNTGITQVSRSGNTVTFQHPQSATPASDVSAAYVWSTDLATYNANGASAGGTTVSFGTSTVAGTTTVTATISGTVPAKLFVALKATQAAP